MSVAIQLFLKKHGKVKILDLAAVQVCSTLCKNKHFCKV